MIEANTLIANTQSLVDSVLEALEDNDREALQSTFLDLEASEIVHLLESIPDAFRGRLWQYIPEEFNGEVLVELGDVARVSLAKYLDHGQVVDAVSDLDTNDLADVIDTLPDELTSTWQLVNLASGNDHKIIQTTHPHTGKEQHVHFSKSGLATILIGVKTA